MIAVFRRAARIAIERPRMASWTTLALTCALFAVAVAGVAALAIDRAAVARPGSTATMVVYLGEDVDEARARALAAELALLRGVERADVVTPDESAHRLVAALGPDATLLDGVDVAALPASVEVTLAPGVHDVVAMSPTVRALRGAPGVADVVVDDPAEDQIASTLGGVRVLAWSTVALFAALAMVTVLAAIRVRLDRDRRELAVAELLGAGPAFSAIPTALAGMMHGIAAAVLATGLLAIALAVYGGALADSLALGGHLALPDVATIAAFVGAGGALGLVGGGLAGASRSEARCGVRV